jgi:hypothetical protein
VQDGDSTIDGGFGRVMVEELIEDLRSRPGGVKRMSRRPRWDRL